MTLAVAYVAHCVISMQICQKFENKTNCRRGSFFASLVRVEEKINILLLTKAFRFPFHTCLGQRSHLNNKNHLICYLAVRQVAEQNINYPIIY